MPKLKNWRKSMARKSFYHGNSVSFNKARQTCPEENSSLCLFEDLQKTEKRLHYIQSRNETEDLSESDEEAQPEKSKIKIAELKQEKQQMKEEIALLKIKIDILLNMLSQATALTTIQFDELKQLRAQISKS